VAHTRVSTCAATIGLALVSIGWTHGTYTVEAKTLREALEKIPCSYISKDGRDLKIAGLSVIANGKSQPMPIVVTKEDEIESIEKRCSLKH
jgi:hypothetical protein